MLKIEKKKCAGWLCTSPSYEKLQFHVYVRTSYIVFFFVKTENNNFIKKMKNENMFLAW